MAAKIASISDQEEEELECLVFGKQSVFSGDGESGGGQALDNDIPLLDTKLDVLSADVFTIDRRGDTADLSDSCENAGNDAGDDSLMENPAWHDEDDTALTVGKAAITLSGSADYPPAVPGAGSYRATLRHRFTAIHGEPEWARLDHAARKRRKRDSGSDGEVYSEDEDERDILTSTGRLLAGAVSSDARGRLRPGQLAIKRSADLSRSVFDCHYPVTALEFHPRASVAVVGGGGNSLAIVQVDGAENPLIQHVPLNRRVRQLWSHFTADGSTLLAGSPCFPHLFTYDMESGAAHWTTLRQRLQLRSLPELVVSGDGRWLAVPAARACSIHLMEAHSRSMAATLQLGSEPTAVAFGAASNLAGGIGGGCSRLWTHSASGSVFEWDVGARACVHRFEDDGCLSGTCVAVSPDGALIACGSSSGIVNVYSVQETRRSASPQPLHVFPQLTTPCTRLVFNSTSELLAMCSDRKDGAVRIAHLASSTVFANFPGWSTAIKRPRALDFSLNSGYLALGCNNARAPLFRLKHFERF